MKSGDFGEYLQAYHRFEVSPALWTRQQRDSARTVGVVQLALVGCYGRALMSGRIEGLVVNAKEALWFRCGA